MDPFRKSTQKLLTLFLLNENLTFLYSQERIILFSPKCSDVSHTLYFYYICYFSSHFFSQRLKKIAQSQMSFLYPDCIIFLSFTLLEFFTSAVADGLSLEFEWQQVSSSLQNSSQYSGRSQ